MLADCLTKPMDSSFLRKVLGLGKFRIYDDSSSLKENPNRKFSVPDGWRHSEKLIQNT